MNPLLALLLSSAHYLPDLTVEKVRAKGGLPTGTKVAIHALRGGVWLRSEEADSAVVKWDRLLPDDRVEICR